MDQRIADSLPYGFKLKGESNTYVIDKVLGQGSFGITYLARYKSTIQGAMGRGTGWIQVAIKEFFMRDMSVRDAATGSLSEMSDDSLSGKYRRAFLREAHNLAGLDHRGIVKVFDVIEANNTVYIVMEYVDGGNLDEYICRRGSLSESEAIPVFREICDAVGHMHRHHMLHLDIKPKNIMLDDDGHPRLIDFGLSKQYTIDGEPESSTTIGLGTPGYAPIEQAERTDTDGSFRPTIDIYALGATLYKMLTGQTPPKASEILNDDELLPSNLQKCGVSKDLIQVVEKAMMPASRMRYQSVDELKKALSEINLPESSSSQKETGDNTEDTVVDVVKAEPKPPVDKNPRHVPKPGHAPSPTPMPPRKGFPKWLYPVIAVIIGLTVYLAIPKSVDSSISKMGVENGYEWVDLGLSVKWATCNVGAEKPEDYGDYYAWGETSTKSSYTWINYKFRTSGDSYENVKFSKYNTESEYGPIDNRSTLDLVDDVARQKWGGSWRMPTLTEFDELIDNCTWTWTALNGVNGYKVTSKISGYTGRSIFLPAAGWRYGTGLIGAGSRGYYWSSSLNTDNPGNARSLYFGSDSRRTDYYRRDGQSVRPVCP